MPPSRLSGWPGSVYPANAGVMSDVDEPRPVSEKRFLLADLFEDFYYVSDAGVATFLGEMDHTAKGLAFLQNVGGVGPVPAGHWPLDETALGTVFDVSGNGNDGSHIGSPTPGVAGIVDED